MLDLVVLTDPHYLDPKEPSPSDINVLKEDQLLLDACRNAGLKVDRKSWDDPNFDWSSSQSVIFRTTWDYFDRFPEFEQWLNRVQAVTKFINPSELVFWNIDKKYLLDLAEKGVEIIPTHIVPRGNSESLKEIADTRNWKDLVIKPTVSATSRDTHQLSYDDLALDRTQRMFDALCEKKSMMVQPFLRNVLEDGELSLVVIDGKVTHGVRKQARKGDYRVQSDFGGSVRLEKPDAEAIRFAEHVASLCPVKPMYARVDLIRNDDGQWNLGEMELIEPELWFRLYPESVERLSSSIARALKK